MRHIISIFVLVGIVGGTSVLAQDDPGSSSLAFQYTISVPLGNTAEFMKKTSLRGATVDYKFHFNDVASVGVSLGWYVFFDQRDYDTYTLKSETMSLSGMQNRYINSIPILVTANYFLMSGAKVSPFAGLGIGTTYNEAALVMGMYSLYVDSWHFTLAPELGARINLAPGVSGLLSGRYNVNFENADLDTQSYIGLNIGVMWKF